jgi:uncharacterized protein (TIGR02266 family)
MLDDDSTMEVDATPVGDELVAVPVRDGRERRTAERVPLEADVSLYSATTFWAGIAEDLSEGGLFVATYQLEPVGTAIDLRFELPTGQTVAVRGVVRWIREVMDEGMPGMGIQFESLLTRDLRVIQSFVKHRPPLVWETE